MPVDMTELVQYIKGQFIHIIIAIGHGDNRMLIDYGRESVYRCFIYIFDMDILDTITIKKFFYGTNRQTPSVGQF